MSNDKKEQASRNPFAEMLEEIQEDNELRKESTSLKKQIDQLRSVIWTLEEDQVTVIQASAEHHLLLYCKGEVHIEGKIVSNLLIN